jgi:ribose transport system permease protein
MSALLRFLKDQGVLIALVLLILFGGLRYDGFLSEYNIMSVLSYSSMFAFVALGMCFVIMTGGIDLSVGSTAAMSSVVAAYASTYGGTAGLIAGAGAGCLVGILNGVLITRLRILPFIATLASMLAASGTGLLLANNQSVSIDYATSFIEIGQGFWFAAPLSAVGNALLGLLGTAVPDEPYVSMGLPIPALMAAAAYVLGSVALNHTGFGRHVLAVGGGEDAARLMGLPVDRTVFLVYVLSGTCSGLAGVILAASYGAGQPIEGIGWELFAIASVVVGGTLLTGGVGSVGATLSGVLLLGLIFNILNFENGLGVVSLSAYWQSVIRGVFLLIVVILQSRITRRRAVA